MVDGEGGWLGVDDIQSFDLIGEMADDDKAFFKRGRCYDDFGFRLPEFII